MIIIRWSAGTKHIPTTYGTRKNLRGREIVKIAKTQAIIMVGEVIIYCFNSIENCALKAYSIFWKLYGEPYQAQSESSQRMADNASSSTEKIL